MGFHRKFGPGANPNSRWFSLLAKAASLTCFEDWHDLATQDGTFGDSQRHDPIPGNEPIQRIIHRWGNCRKQSPRDSIGRGDDGRIRGLVRQRRDRRTPGRAADPGARRTDALGYQMLARRITRRNAAELRAVDHREGRDQCGAGRVSARISSGGHCRQRVRLRSRGLDIDAFLGAVHRRQRTDPWTHRP